MPTKLEIALIAIHDLYRRGYTATAIDETQIVTAEALITIAQQLAEINKHLADIVQDRPITLEKAAKAKKES